MTATRHFIFIIISISVLLMIVTVPAVVFSQECTSVPGTRYNVGYIDRMLGQAEQFLRGCSGGNNNCREADRRLREADVAIIQILTECTRTGNCLRGGIGTITNRAGRLAEQSRRLVRQSGMRRTYDNTLTTLRSWGNTRRCPTARCRQYASRAVSQNQENLRRRCGFTGTRWTSVYKGHYDWCFTAPQNVANSETQARANALRQCQARPNHGPRCQQYASRAVSQNQENLRRRCGYKGARWTSNYQGHYRWCMSARQSLANSETQARANALRQCKPQTRSCPGPGMTVVHKLVNHPPYPGYSVICRDGSGRLWMQGANAAQITSIVREQWNNKTGCYDRSKVVTSSGGTLAGRLCRP